MGIIDFLKLGKEYMDLKQTGKYEDALSVGKKILKLVKEKNLKALYFNDFGILCDNLVVVQKSWL